MLSLPVLPPNEGRGNVVGRKYLSVPSGNLSTIAIMDRLPDGNTGVDFFHKSVSRVISVVQLSFFEKKDGKNIKILKFRFVCTMMNDKST